VTAALLSALLLAGPARAEIEEGSSFWGLIEPGGMVLFYDSVGPMSYVALSTRDIPAGARLAGEVRGRGCQHGFSIPLGSPLNFSMRSLSVYAGRGGFERAFREMRERRPGLKGIYDAKLDWHTLSILGFYRRTCLEISALGFE
jgi:hypothetical protein